MLAGEQPDGFGSNRLWALTESGCFSSLLPTTKQALYSAFPLSTMKKPCTTILPTVRMHDNNEDVQAGWKCNNKSLSIANPVLLVLAPGLRRHRGLQLHKVSCPANKWFKYTYSLTHAQTLKVCQPGACCRSRSKVAEEMGAGEIDKQNILEAPPQRTPK